MKKTANSNIKARMSGVSLVGLLNYSNRKQVKETYKRLSTPDKLPAAKGRPRTSTQHTGFLSVQRALQKKK